MRKPLLLWGALLPAAIVGADQLSKWWATRFFDQPMDICAREPGIRLSFEVLPVFDLALLCNRGVSFGLLGGDGALKRWALTLLAVAVCGFLVWTLRTTRDTLSRLGIALIIGGAVGNAIDRALYGAVTDFLDFSDIGFDYVFNIADSAITVGVVALLAGAVLEGRREARGREALSATDAPD